MSAYAVEGLAESPQKTKAACGSRLLGLNTVSPVVGIATTQDTHNTRPSIAREVAHLSLFHFCVGVMETRKWRVSGRLFQATFRIIRSAPPGLCYNRSASPSAASSFVLSKRSGVTEIPPRPITIASLSGASGRGPRENCSQW